MSEIEKNPSLELQVVAGASAMLDRFGRVEKLIREDGFKIDHSFYSIVEGENPTTMAKSTGLGIIEMSMVLGNLEPDYVVVVGDRFEMMSITIAAAYMNIRIVHTMGGEVTGTIDESIRHSITKFAHVHFPSSEDAYNRLVKLGENPEYIFNYGCPRIDLVRKELKKNSIEYLKSNMDKLAGIGKPINVEEPFLLVSQHPVTTEFGSNRKQMRETLEAIKRISMPTILLWPNVDAGSDEISKEIRSFREQNNLDWLSAYINVPTDLYIHLLNTVSCLVGNSSSGIREGAFIGTPVVNIGSRQNKRQRASNVLDAIYDSKLIENAIREQIKKGRYKMSKIYGDGFAGEKIAQTLVTSNPPVQKHITY